MPKPIAAQPYLPGPAVQPASVSALRALGGESRSQTAYHRLLIERLFDAVEIEDRKTRAKHQKTLLRRSSLAILMIVWKESEHVSDEELALADVSRVFSTTEPLNCHSLATRLADEPKNLGRTLKRIETIVAAATAYGLIERVPLTNARWKALRGTASLHQLMLHLGASLWSIYSDVAAQRFGDL